MSDRKYSGAVSRAFHLQVVEGLNARIAELEHQLEVQSMLARANQRDLSAEQSAGRDLFVRLRELEAERDRLTKRVQAISSSVEHHVATRVVAMEAEVVAKLASCELARAGHIVTLDLCYPRNEGNATTIELGLTDVRAADPIRITYDFDRDGWSISQAADRRFDVAADSRAWQEVAFVQAWALSEKGDDP